MLKDIYNKYFKILLCHSGDWWGHLPVSGLDCPHRQGDSWRPTHCATTSNHFLQLHSVSQTSLFFSWFKIQFRTKEFWLMPLYSANKIILKLDISVFQWFVLPIFMYTPLCCGNGWSVGWALCGVGIGVGCWLFGGMKYRKYSSLTVSLMWAFINASMCG